LVKKKRHKSESFLARAQGLAHIGSWLIELPKERLTWSDELYRIFGFQPHKPEISHEMFLRAIHPEDLARREAAYAESLRTGKHGYIQTFRIIRKNIPDIRWICEACFHERNETGTVVRSIGMIQDITERKETEQQRSMSLEILEILNRAEDFRAAADQLLAVIQRETGIEAVGIRIAHEKDFHYYAHAGFPQAFVDAKHLLCSYSEDGILELGPDGKPLRECTCSLVLQGRTDPANPLFSPGGSAWTNDSSPFAQHSPGQPPQSDSCNLCLKEGYRSIALIPIRSGPEIVGLLQLNDKRPDRFPAGRIALLEGIAMSVGIAFDRHRSAENLRQSVEHLRLALDAAKAGIWEWNLRNNTNVWSNSLWKLYGLDPLTDKASYESWRKALHPSDRDRAEQAVQQAVTGGVELNAEWRICMPDGTERLLMSRGRPLKDEAGRVMRYISVVVDISNIRQAENEREKLREQLFHSQKMESVGLLAGGVAHDFNNMLQVILGYVELIRNELDPAEKLHEALVEIGHAARCSTDLTRQLLTFARKQTITPEVLDLNEAIRDMLAMLRRLIGENIELFWAPAKGNTTVKIDPSQLNQILANLAVNARDAIAGVGRLAVESGTMTLDEAYCACRVDAIPGEYVTLTVSDTGCGMDKETLAHIFEPFFTTKRIGKGTGLGLATVYGIVSQNKGFMEVHSAPEKGTTFKIFLPRHLETAEAHPPNDPTATTVQGSETVLVVEDEPPLLKVCTRMLESLGYRVLAADSPEHALQLAGEHAGKIDVLLTDVVMPGMNGKDLAEKLTTLYPGLKHLFMSGCTANVISGYGVMPQGIHFIPKPFSTQALGEKLRATLR